ncbi:hypothetical protein KCU74_g80, partial [Aureobasidium melanogenum]
MAAFVNMDATQYDAYIERKRETEYPMLKDATYLDHAGTTLYSKSLLEAFTADMLGNLYGNPHSASQASQRSTHQVQDVRLQLLRFFDANPDDFDLVFVANATAGIKVVADALLSLVYASWLRNTTALLKMKRLKIGLKMEVKVHKLVSDSSPTLPSPT